jgi:hypothetical protein
MRHFRSILFALAAFLWLPASAHCQIESISGFEFLHCGCVEQEGPGDCVDCGCCTIEKSQYRASLLRLTVPAPELVALILTTAMLTDEAVSDECRTGDLTAAPPDLQPSRHFNFRTALPPRAPSLGS